MERSASVYPNPYRAEFLAWIKVAEADTPPAKRQHPLDELLAEHHLIRLVVMMMQSEAKRLATHQPFRSEFWVPAIDFIGNFGLLYHYRKKANHVFPLASELGFGGAISELDRDQQIDIDLTLEIVDAVQEGDWEKVLRLVVMLVSTKRQKMDLEEKSVLLPLRPKLTPALVEGLEKGFADVEEKALPEKGRSEYLEIARSLAKLTGLPDPAMP